MTYEHAKLDNMFKGWFVGDFQPTLFNSKDVEVAIKYYKAGDVEELHHHKVSTEITAIVQGQVKMLDRVWSAGDILLLEPGTATSFEAITDSINVVVKLPSVKNDKYIGSPALCK